MANTTSKTTTQVPKMEEGQLVHTEFITSNGKELANFLAKNFNWKIDTQKMPGGGGDYHLFTTPGGSVGGIGEPMPGSNQGTFSYIAVKDLKATTKKLEKAGATILMPPTEVPNMGWFCQWKYKNSPVICCWQATGGNGSN